MKSGLIALLIALVALPMFGVQAQGRDDLSEEEQALLDRVITALEGREEYVNFNLTSEETTVLNFNLTILGQSVEFSQNSTISSESLVIKNGDSENIARTMELTYEEIEPDATISYTIAAEVVFLDDVLYVNAEVVDSESDFGPIEEGWQVFESAEDIPEVLEELDLGDLFDEEISPLERIDIIERSVSSISSEPDEIDGMPVENITLEFSGDGMTELFSGMMEEQDEENPFIEVMLSSASNGEATLVVALDENDQLVATAFRLTLSMQDVSLDEFEIEELPAGTVLSLEMEETQIDIASNIDAEVEPIEVPVE